MSEPNQKLLELLRIALKSPICPFCGRDNTDRQDTGCISPSCDGVSTLSWYTQQNTPVTYLQNVPRNRGSHEMRMVTDREKLRYRKPACAQVSPDPFYPDIRYTVANNGNWGKVRGLIYWVPCDFEFEFERIDQ